MTIHACRNWKVFHVCCVGCDHSGATTRISVLCLYVFNSVVSLLKEIVSYLSLTIMPLPEPLSKSRIKVALCELAQLSGIRQDEMQQPTSVDVEEMLPPVRRRLSSKTQDIAQVYGPVPMC